MPTEVYSSKWLQNNGLGYKCDICFNNFPVKEFDLYTCCMHGVCRTCHKKYIWEGQFFQDHCFLCKACDCGANNKVAREVLVSGGKSLGGDNLGCLASLCPIMSDKLGSYYKNLMDPLRTESKTFKFNLNRNQ